jgi:hypothetical protein
MQARHETGAIRNRLAKAIHAATARSDQRYRHDRQPSQTGPNHVTVLVPGDPRNYATSPVAASRRKMNGLTIRYRSQNRQNPENRYNPKT